MTSSEILVNRLLDLFHESRGHPDGPAVAIKDLVRQHDNGELVDEPDLYRQALVKAMNPKLTKSQATELLKGALREKA